MDLNNNERQFQHEGDKSVQQILAQPSKGKREDTNSQQRETSVIIGNLWSMLGIDSDMIAQHLAGLVERIVHEELESRLLVPRPTIIETGPSEAQLFKLVFENNLPRTVFTHSNIRANDNRLVEIALYDIRSQSKVTAGSLSSVSVGICVLDDDVFGSNGCEDWTTDQFNKAKILRLRKNKERLLKGKVVIPLKNGAGYIDNVVFTDNSSRTRSRHFRLGAFVKSASHAAEVREAITERFMVKENRGEGKQKHYPPLPNDPIWCLINISRKGPICKRLSELKINCVEDLLHVNKTNPSSLQDQKSGRISAKLLKAIEHAKTCISEGTSNGQNCNYPLITCNPDEKRLETEQQHAQDVFTPANQTSAHSFPSPLASLQVAGQCSAPDLQVLDLPTTAQQDQLEKRPDFSQPSTSTPHIGEAWTAYNNQIGFAELYGMCMEGNDTSLDLWTTCSNRLG